jgi:carboxylesterase 2
LSFEKFANVPILAGTNKDEFRVFLAVLGLNSDAAAALSPTVAAITGVNISSIQSSLLGAYSAEGVTDALLSR